MKKILAKIFIVTILFAGVSTAFVPHEVKAADAVSSMVQTLVDISATSFSKILYYIGYWTLSLSSLALKLSGILLNAALNATLHISDLVNKVPAIGLTWRTIRDFSSIFFIFLLIYASISTILGLKGTTPKQLIVNIVMCGLLINFSLFFTKVIIDTSNVVSLGFYNAIAPDNATADGGISNIFSQSLRVVTVYNPTGVQKAAKADFEKRVGPGMFLGSIVMFIAAGSFFVVSIMLIVRIAILIILMAFSPLYFLSLVLPATGEMSSKWLKLLTGQALFAPIYLAIIYVVMRIVSSPQFGSMMYGGDANPSFSQAFIDGGAVGVVLNYIIVIILLNMALVVARQFGTMGGDYSGKAIKWFQKLGSDTIKGTTSFGMRHGVGRVASKFDDRLANTHFGNSSIVRSLRSISTTPLAKSKFGGSKSYQDVKKLRKEIDSKEREINKMQDVTALARLPDTEPKKLENLRKAIKDLNNKAISSMSMKELSQPIIAAHLTQSQLDDIKKGEMSDEDKDKITSARKSGLMQILKVTPQNNSTTEAAVKEMLTDRKTEEIAKLPADILTIPAVSIQLDGNTLAKIARDGLLDTKARQTIRDNFDMHATLHGASATPQFQEAYKWLTGTGAPLF